MFQLQCHLTSCGHLTSLSVNASLVDRSLVACILRRLTLVGRLRLDLAAHPPSAVLCSLGWAAMFPFLVCVATCCGLRLVVGSWSSAALSFACYTWPHYWNQDHSDLDWGYVGWAEWRVRTGQKSTDVARISVLTRCRCSIFSDQTSHALLYICRFKNPAQHSLMWSPSTFLSDKNRISSEHFWDLPLDIPIWQKSDFVWALLRSRPRRSSERSSEKLKHKPTDRCFWHRCGIGGHIENPIRKHIEFIRRIRATMLVKSSE